MIKYLSLLLLLLLCYCHPARVKTKIATSTRTSSSAEISTLPPPKHKTITLLAESSPNDQVFAYYLDEFQDFHNLSFTRDSAGNQYLPLTLESQYGLWLRFTKGIAHYPVYVKPGDSLRIKSFARGQVNYVFSGRNPGDYNFYTLLDQQAFGLGFTDIMGVEINDFKFRQRTRMLNYLFRERMQFVDRIKDSLALTPGFQNYLTNHITSVYLTALLTPFYAPEFKLPLSQTYIDTLADFQHTAFLKQDSLIFSSEHYRLSVAHYNRFLSRHALKTPQENQVLYQSARENFSGQVRNFALFSFLKEKIKQDLDMAPYLTRFREDCTYQPYIDYLDSLASRPSKLTRDKMLLDNALVTDTDQVTTWAGILNQNKGKVIYVDLWATWCGPCLMEMPASVALQEKLKGRDIAFVTITVDAPKDKDKWKKALVTHSLNKGGYQNYMIDVKSPLAVFIHGQPNGVAIPQYILIDKSGAVAAIEAKRPSEKPLLAEMLLLLNR